MPGSPAGRPDGGGPADGVRPPATWRFGYPVHHPADRDAWRAWLEAHQHDTPGVWVAVWRSSTGRDTVSYDAIVEEALCVGWIDSTVNVLDDVEALVEPEDLAAALDAAPAARQSWDGFPPSARSQMLFWVVSAVKDETRRRRVATIVDAAARGERARG